MLRLTENNFSRREFLSVGSLAMGGLALPHLLQAQDAIKQLGGVARDKTVIFLFMHVGHRRPRHLIPRWMRPRAFAA